MNDIDTYPGIINYTDMDLKTQIFTIRKIHDKLKNHPDVIITNTGCKMKSCENCKYSVIYGMFNRLKCSHILHLNEKVSTSTSCNIHEQK